MFAFHPHTLENFEGPKRGKASGLRQGWGLGPDSSNLVIILKDLEGYISGNYLLDLQLRGDT